MGQKTVAIIGGLIGLSICCSIGAVVTRIHTVSFFTVYVLRAVRLETRLLTVEISDKSSAFCNILNKISPNLCAPGTFMLQDVAQQFCAPAIANFYNQGCEGFWTAYVMGTGWPRCGS